MTGTTIRTIRFKTTPTKLVKNIKLSKPQGKAYEYLDLASVMKHTKQDPVNFYGVIIDASFPYTKTNPETGDVKHLVQCKVVDETYFTKETKKVTFSEKYTTVCFMASSFDELPRMQRVGDIIRIHRGEVNSYKGKSIVNVNMKFNSSWCLFTGSQKIAPLENVNKANFKSEPFSHSNKTYSFEKGELKILNNLRTWSQKKFLSKNIVSPTQNDAKELKTCLEKGYEFDLFGKISRVREINTYLMEIALNDIDGNTWYSEVFKRKFSHIKEGDVCRWKSVKADSRMKEANCLWFSQHSNIMKYLPGSKAIDHDDLQAVSDHPYSFRRIESELALNKQNATLDYTSLEKMYDHPDEMRYKCRLQVVKNEPKDVKEFVQGYNPTKKEFVSLKGLTKAQTKKLDLVYNVTLQVRDAYNCNDKNEYEINISSLEKTCKKPNFKGMTISSEDFFNKTPA